MKREHSEIIKAWADGKEIEFEINSGEWIDCTNSPGWLPGVKYRIKRKKWVQKDSLKTEAINEREKFRTVCALVHEFCHDHKFSVTIGNGVICANYFINYDDAEKLEKMIKNEEVDI